ncbi:hypothetical protein L9F63_000839, partial [Diploptera punctata]
RQILHVLLHALYSLGRLRSQHEDVAAILILTNILCNNKDLFQCSQHRVIVLKLIRLAFWLVFHSVNRFAF